jgi:mono/diheme cytochrome c family protein
MVEASNEEIFSAIRSGTAGVAPSMEAHLHDHDHDSSSEEEGFGSPAMPYWGFTLSDQEIWSIVAFIRTLHKNDAPPVEFSDKINAQRVRPVVAAPIEIPSLNSPEGQKLASQGRTLFEERYACTACHELNGAGGKVGPALDRAGVRMNPDWLYRWIQDPKAMKKHATMPAFALPGNEAKAITLYLQTLQAPPAL